MQGLNLEKCISLQMVYYSLGDCKKKKLIKLNLYRWGFSMCSCEVSWTSESWGFQKIGGPTKIWKNKIGVRDKGKRHLKRKIPSSIIQHRAHLTELDFSAMKKLVALPNVGYVEKDKGK